jgi:hypothetical protein
LNNEVIDMLRLLRKNGTRVVSLESPMESTVYSPAALEKDQPNEEAAFIQRARFP